MKKINKNNQYNELTNIINSYEFQLSRLKFGYKYHYQDLILCLKKNNRLNQTSNGETVV